ncbi:hypothetical protein VOLCADRAFT_104657 [Volvox carteri f. nagariensis]|uniref:Uncharacterized protein n=1 Tax=Volvox carteri f. nagariensis TaxID=3068 RepID=D8TVL9_VOLCA|nr:uncharacterized protein VOLCADRAFT_104657 [Volvox carteri f. nagariensis]EFJ48606.1 hypothetical protein VOLCADRAFT_104657 [Volvox carteri f. nagariensis]|eukprot:XP_002950405.1 hypothetical protein VOLCADRAFT_104657 [Volvox carteri f. nagariensis]
MQAVLVPVSRATPLCTRTSQLCPVQVRHRARMLFRVLASKDSKDDVVSGAIKAANGLVDKATDLVPETVPRPAARAGVAIASVMFIFWLLQKVISGVLTLALFAGVGYYFLTQQMADKDDTIDVTPPSKKGGRSGEDLDDPLAEARRIMDKYK